MNLVIFGNFQVLLMTTFLSLLDIVLIKGPYLCYHIYLYGIHLLLVIDEYDEYNLADGH